MSEPIKAGDLVVVVRWPCCSGEVGWIFSVKELRTSSDGWCLRCGSKTGHTGAQLKASDGLGLVPVAWLKRIPPLSELEGERQDEALVA
jgi:hypothetical protein